jgi:hypothetical protein
MLSLRVSLPGQQPLSVGLNRLRATITDWTPYWTNYFVPAWYALEQAQYASEGASGGSGWPALTARYAAWKQKHYPGQPIGVLTGAARTALTDPTGAGAVLLPGQTSFTVGTDLPYPIYLQLGTRKMAARPPMQVTDDFMRTVGRTMNRFVQDVLTKANLPLPLTGGAA